MQNRVDGKNNWMSGKLALLRSWFGAAQAAPSRRSGPVIEGLESRELFSGGPTLTGVELMGPVGGISSVVLTFSEPLNAATAENTLAYAFGKPPAPRTSDSSGLSIGDFFAFKYPGQEKAAAQKVKLVKLGKIQMSSALYDPASDTVTLTPLAPFTAATYFRFLRIKGSGPNTIDDTLGNPLNSGQDTVARWTRHEGRTVNYHDATGNHVTLKLTGPGKLYVFTRNSKDTNPVIFVQGATTATTLNGMLKHSGKILPTVNIAEIQGASGITDNLLNNPMFNVATTVG